ncbi:MAG: hypothetical protein HXS41_07645 [Theionarchaea archaeon]|nr:hypothetical protein [Theionarchaea archaeon]MBU7000202.1 hypothetical protein [Theionarchaea archaeon]MBU7020919.1 hypothetical protein [Theionarchaea archaeon]MBU7033971.1 hypothetical protein [Theionarchaea archaeon]MBU7040533.1 hypothetical protein [Theionarchaea archaeon]
MLSELKRKVLRMDEELETLAWLISVIDSYRVGMGVDMEGLRDRTRKLRESLRMENWSQVYSDMKAITDLPYSSEPRMKLYINIFAFMRYLVKQAFLIVAVILLVAFMSARMPFISPHQLPYILYAIIAVAWCVVAIRAFVKDRMKLFYSSHQKEYRKSEERLQKVAQDLILKMGSLLTEKGESPKKYKFSVYQRDYNGIEILKSPGVLRDFYVIAVKKR